MKRVSLGELGKIVSGATPKTGKAEYWNGTIFWITPADLSESDEIYFRGPCKRITQTGFDSCSTTMVPADSILFSSRAPIGHCALSAYPLCTNQGFKSLVPNARLNPLYGYYALKSVTPYIISRGRGATFGEVSKEIMEAVQIIYREPDEQREVANTLLRADRLRRLRRHALEMSENFIYTIFLQLFGDSKSNSKNLPVTTIGKSLGLASGDSMTAASMGDGGLFPVYGGNGVSGFHTSYMFEERRIVIGRVGAYCGAVHYTAPKCWISDNALYLKEKDEKLTDVYLTHALREANLNQYADRSGQPLISQGRLENVQLLVPSDKLQESFCQIVQKHEKLESLKAEACRQAEHLFQTLLHDAFSGSEKCS